MKRTNYVILAMVVLSFLSIFVMYAVAYMSVNNGEILKVEGELQHAEYAGIGVVDIDVEEGFFRSSMKINIVQADSDRVGVVYPSGWDKYMRAEMYNDTLRIDFNFKELVDGDKKIAYKVESDPIIVKLPKNGVSTVDVRDCYAFLSLDLVGVESDSLSVSAMNEVSVKDCNIRSLSVPSSYRLKLYSGSVVNLHVPVDVAHATDVSPQNFKIDTEYISKVTEPRVNYEITIPEGLCRRIITEPGVRLKLKERAEITFSR